jgi:hypothetical protein
MDIALSIALGIGLSAAVGFRIFVPFLIMSSASLAGLLPLHPSFEWIGTVPALVVFATATLVEVLAYFIPWVDHAMDVIATPTAVIAGAVATASVLVDLPPVFQWGVAILGGGGAAGLIQGASALLRMKSTALTAGLGNPILAATELIGSIATSVLAILAPLLTFLLLLFLAVLVFRSAGRVLFGRRTAP